MHSVAFILAEAQWIRSLPCSKSFEKSWEYVNEVNACFVDLKKAYDRISRDKLWAVLLQYGIDGQLLTAIKSLYMHSEVCVSVNKQRNDETFRSNCGTTARLLSFTYSIPYLYE